MSKHEPKNWLVSPSMIAIYITVISMTINGLWMMVNYSHDNASKSAVTDYKVSVFEPQVFLQMQVDIKQMRSDISDIKALLKSQRIEVVGGR